MPELEARLREDLRYAEQLIHDPRAHPWLDHAALQVYVRDLRLAISLLDEARQWVRVGKATV